MTHAERIRELERAVIKAAKARRRACRRAHRKIIIYHTHAENDAVDALLAAEAETCPTCDGTGEREIALPVSDDMNGIKVHVIEPHAVPCGCDAGRWRTP